MTIGRIQISLLLSLLILSVACNKDSGSSDSTPSTSNTTVTPDNSVADPTSPAIPTNPTKPTVPVTPAPPVVVITDPTMTQDFMELVNDHRETLGLEPLIHDEEMAVIVTKHSMSMANGSVAFGHTGFSTRCNESKTALGGGNWCGENVAMGQKTVQAAFTSWMNSSGHKANIESSRATHTGFGFAKSSSGTYYWTQIFVEKEY